MRQSLPGYNHHLAHQKQMQSNCILIMYDLQYNSPLLEIVDFVDGFLQKIVKMLLRG